VDAIGEPDVTKKPSSGMQVGDKDLQDHLDGGDFRPISGAR
jgi:hypothetical protein